MNYPYAEINDRFNKEHIDFLTDYFLKENSAGLAFYFPYISYKPGVRIFEESHQLAVCQNLLAKGCKVFVEPTKFLDEEIVTSLSNQWGDLIQFVALADLEKDNQPLFKINL